MLARLRIGNVLGLSCRGSLTKHLKRRINKFKSIITVVLQDNRYLHIMICVCYYLPPSKKKAILDGLERAKQIEQIMTFFRFDK